MAIPPSGDRSRGLSLLVFGIAVLGFATPLRLLWAHEGRPWYLPFVLWLVVTLLALWAARASKAHET